MSDNRNGTNSAAKSSLLVFSLAKNDFKTKYAGSALGIIWAFINPVITILIYWFVFQVAFGNSGVGNVPYVLWLVAGIVPWFFFSDGWGGVTGAFSDYSYLVKKVVFDAALLPKIRVMSAFFIHIFFVILIFVIYFGYGLPLRSILIQVLYYMCANVLLVFSIGRISAVLNAFIKDTGNIVGIFVQFGFWLTPIFWNISDIPANLVFIFKLSPIYYIVQGFRDTFIFGVPFWHHPLLTAYFWMLTILLFVLGHLLFKRSKPHLADLL